MDTLVSFLLCLVRDLTGYWLLRMCGNERPGELATTFVGVTFWVLVAILLTKVLGAA